MSRARDTANFDPSLLADDEVSLDKLGTSGTLDVSSATLTTSTAQKQAIVQAGPGSGTVDVSSGTFTTSTAQKQTIVQAGPGSGTLDVSSGTFTTSTAQKQAIVDGADIEGTAVISTGETGGSKFLREDGDGSCSWQAVTGIPSGMIAPFGMSSAPTGWLACDGSAVSRTTYSALFSAISTTWGTGDGSTTFNIPDLRNAFLRGVGTSTIFTQNNTTTLAQTQNDSLQNHAHVSNLNHSVWGSAGGSAYMALAAGASSGPRSITSYNSTASVGGRQDNETRPVNRGVQYMIKI